MRGPTRPDNSPLFEYTLMPTHMRHTFGVDELQNIALQEPFVFTKGCRTMKIPSRAWKNPHEFGTLLFDLQNDPQQEKPFSDDAIEKRMRDHLVRLMRENDAPADQFERLGITADL